MSLVKTGNTAHDLTVAASEGIRQASVAAAASQAAARTADIAHYRACLSSAKSAGCGQTTFIRALQELGTGGA